MIVLLLVVTLIHCGSAVVKPQIFPSNVNISGGCQAAILKLSTLQATEPELMARYWDSWGKPNDGAANGHTTSLGYYDECLDLKNTAVGETNYCIYTMQKIFTTHHNSSYDEVCYSSDCGAQTNDAVSSNIQVGVCYPSSCSPNEFASVLKKMESISITTHTHVIQLTSIGESPAFCPQTDVDYDMGTVLVLAACSIFIGLVILATGLDFTWWLLSSDDLKDKNHKEQSITKPGLGDLISQFSLSKTVPTLLSTKQSPSSIKAVGSLKVIANLLTTGFHVYLCIMFYYPQLSQNTAQYFGKYHTRIFNQLFMNTTFAVDTFFVVSATLSSYLTFKDLEKYKKFRFMNFYIGRYFRLAPVLYLATFVALKLFVHSSEGPLWHSPDLQACQLSWWRNLLFVNNLVSPEYVCIVPSWHVSADMQMFIVSPIIILTLYYAPVIGLIVIGLSITGFTATVGAISIRNDYWAATHAGPNVFSQLLGLHMNPVFRASPYLVGIVLGYILYKKYSIADLPIRKSLQNKLSIILWIIAIYLCKITLFGTIEEFNGTRHFTQWENATFLMFSGLVWSIGISIIIFFCNTGYGGVVNSVLSWPGWDPLVRLSYGVYLFHMLVIFYILGSLQSTLIFTDTLYIMLCVFVIVASFSLSVVLTLTVELPISKVVSLCFKLAGMESRHK